MYQLLWHAPEIGRYVHHMLQLLIQLLSSATSHSIAKPFDVWLHHILPKPNFKNSAVLIIRYIALGIYKFLWSLTLALLMVHCFHRQQMYKFLITSKVTVTGNYCVSNWNYFVDSWVNSAGSLCIIVVHYCWWQYWQLVAILTVGRFLSVLKSGSLCMWCSSSRARRGLEHSVQDDNKSAMGVFISCAK